MACYPAYACDLSLAGIESHGPMSDIEDRELHEFLPMLSVCWSS